MLNQSLKGETLPLAHLVLCSLRSLDTLSGPGRSHWTGFVNFKPQQGAHGGALRG